MSEPYKAYELACTMLIAIGWNGHDFRLRDRVVIAIEPEVRRLNEQMKEKEAKE